MVEKAKEGEVIEVSVPIILDVVSYVAMAMFAVLVVLSATRRWDQMMDGAGWRFGIRAFAFLAFAGLVAKAALFPTADNVFVAAVRVLIAVGAFWATVEVGRFIYGRKGQGG